MIAILQNVSAVEVVRLVFGFANFEKVAVRSSEAIDYRHDRAEDPVFR
jgi:hypothetical protein